jgi:hypothetical protein
MLIYSLQLVSRFLMTVLVVPGPVSRPLSASAPTQDSLSLPGWMAGCWQQRVGSRVVEEQWMIPSGRAMVGMGRTVVGDQMRAWESLRMVEEAGRVVYIAQPNGGAPTRFPATGISDSLVVFENPSHDFPQRIAYLRRSTDSLVASISATRDGRVQRMDIPMRRTSCER